MEYHKAHNDSAGEPASPSPRSTADVEEARPRGDRREQSRRRGLAVAENLKKLACVWLDQAHELYPGQVAAGLVPPNSNQAAEELACEFERRFVGLEGPAPGVQAKRDGCLAIAYLRYSDENSNPRSLDDQLIQVMQRAAANGRFAPWSLVFADAGVSGRSSRRQGFQQAKQAAEAGAIRGVDHFYVDDCSRLARSAMDTLRLASHLAKHRIRLIGVSDGFDSKNVGSDLQLSIFGALNEHFSRSLAAKVLRGMKGAARRGTSVGLLPFGFRLEPQLDDAGQPRLSPADGSVINIPAVDPDAMEQVIQAAKWLIDERVSYKEIARRFNASKVKDHERWTGPGIRQLLSNPLFDGRLIYNRSRTIIDPETGRRERQPNPKDEWTQTNLPHLRRWPDGLWDRVQKRIEEVRAAAPNTGSKRPPRVRVNELYPTTIFDNLLICGSCGRPLRLTRSVGDSKQIGCPSGSSGLHGCKLKSSKSIRHISAGLLGYVRDQVLTPGMVKTLVRQANAVLMEERGRPLINIKPLSDRVTGLQRQRDKIVDLAVEHADHHDVELLLTKSDKLRQQIEQVQRQLREAEAANAKPPPPLDEQGVLEQLEDLRGLLEQEVGPSAAALKALLGEVVVHEQAVEGRKRKLWIGQVRGDLVPFMANAARLLETPDSDTWEFLCTRIWKMPLEAEVPLEKPPSYVTRAAEFKQLHDRGVSLELIARQSGVAYTTVEAAVRYAETGRRPDVPSRPGRTERGTSPRVYDQILDDVVRLRRQGMSAPKIVTWLQEHRDLRVSASTVRRAWDHANPDVIEQAVKTQQIPAERGRYRHLSQEVEDKIADGLQQGLPAAEVARRAGCSVSTVNRRKR